MVGAGGHSGRMDDALDARWLDWVDRYVVAWRTAGTELLAGLFTPDAVYLRSPYAKPDAGLPAIERMWEAGRDGPDEPFTITRSVVAVRADASGAGTGVLRCLVQYGGERPQEYTDLWVVDLDADGLCTRYEEWPFWPRRRFTAAADGGQPCGSR